MAAAIDTRAHALAALGRWGEALAAFEKAAELGGSAYVRAYQNALAKRGLYGGRVDGVYGGEVRDALTACLEAHCRLLK